jgi:hypothetical protein
MRTTAIALTAATAIAAVGFTGVNTARADSRWVGPAIAGAAFGAVVAGLATRGGYYEDSYVYGYPYGYPSYASAPRYRYYAPRGAYGGGAYGAYAYAPGSNWGGGSSYARDAINDAYGASSP